MKIAVSAFLPAKRNMYVDACQRRESGFKRDKFLCAVLIFILSFMGIDAMPVKMIFVAEGDTMFVNNNITPKYFSDYTQKNKLLSLVRNTLYRAGYIAAEIDSLKEDSLISVIKINTGKKYKWARLRTDAKDEEWLKKISNIYSAKDNVFSPAKVSDYFDNVLKNAEENGYPFANIFLDSLQIHETEISAKINFKTGRQYIWDSLTIQGDSTINPAYISTMLGIKKGEPYKESVSKNLEKKLRNISFIKVLQHPVILFSGGKVFPVVFIEVQRSGRVNGVLGLTPSTSDTKKFRLTGEAEFEMQNLLGEGLDFFAAYRNFLSSASEVRLRSAYSYIAGKPLGIEAAFSLLKYDSTYNAVDIYGAAKYFFGGTNFIKIKYTSSQTHLLNGGYYTRTNQKPPYLDAVANWYGIGIYMQEFDNIFNPRSGYRIMVDAEAGTKQVQKNAALDEKIYEGIKLYKTVYRLQINSDYFIPLRKRSCVLLHLAGGWLADEDAALNQQFRFGGLNSIRGFDEGIFTATHYGLSTIEYRFLTDEYSSLRVFVDGGWYKSASFLSDREDRLYAAGAGYNYYTKAGMFSINFAAGSSVSTTPDFAATKIHVGYLSRF